MKAYPTNRKKLTKPILEYPAGTRFRTANGMIAVLRPDSESTAPVDTGIGETTELAADMDVIGTLTEGENYGTWFNDGTKAYPDAWPPNSHIVEVLQ